MSSLLCAKSREGSKHKNRFLWELKLKLHSSGPPCGLLGTLFTHHSHFKLITKKCALLQGSWLVFCCYGAALTPAAAQQPPKGYYCELRSPCQIAVRQHGQTCKECNPNCSKRREGATKWFGQSKMPDISALGLDCRDFIYAVPLTFIHFFL